MPGSLHRLLYIATAVPLLLVIIGIIMMLVDLADHWLGWWQYGTRYALLL